MLLLDIHQEGERTSLLRSTMVKVVQRSDQCSCLRRKHDRYRTRQNGLKGERGDLGPVMGHNIGF